jgi:S-(hydroxymethyl)glutathione dehydrogenase / alcohol dehydrogenase
MTTPRTMQAAILLELRKPLVVEEVELPRTLDVGQVLVKVHASGICGSQLGEIDGVKGEDRYLPHLLGHEGSGTIVETGPGVRHVKAGDKVVLHWRKGAGIEAAPAKYQWRGQLLNAGWVTTFNEYAVVSENRVTTIPADSDMEVAALFGCAVTTGFGVVTNNAKLTIGESVVVFGAGGIGLNIVQAAALVTAQPIIAVDLHDSRLELARQFGATHTINSKRTQAREEIQRICAGGVDAFIDNTGNPDVIAMGYELTKPAGRVVLVGVPAKGRNVSLYSLPLHFGKELRGSHGGDAVPQADIPRYAALYRAGRIRLKELVTERFALGDINTAIERMRDGRLAGRCSIQMDH